MGKSKKVWVDSAHTRTADDVVELSECDALIRRFARDISEIIAKGGDQRGAPYNLRYALKCKDVGLTQLKARRELLTSSVHS